MYIGNVKVLNENNIFEDSRICVEKGLFTTLPTEDEICLDGEGCYVIPGLIDIHFHGCVGEDVSDVKGSKLDKICEYQARNGITSICPATMTIPEEELVRVLGNILDYAVKEKANSCSSKPKAVIVGINLEGPFISEAKKGAHDGKNIRKCDINLFDKLYEASNGLIKIVDLAPETEGAINMIEKISNRVTVSLAHTTADYEIASKAFEHGASHVTHLYNAMPEYEHRNPGVVGAALDNGKVSVELICDGVHVHPSVIRGSFKMFGDDRIIIVSDSIRATGLSEGEYSLGGQKVIVRDKVARLENNTIAGSVSNLMDSIRFLVNEVGIPLETAVKCASINPARRIGTDDECGSISMGKRADFVMLDEKLNVRAVYIAGEKVE